ncbi:hypothetical protein [Domibacillus epiphyticus]|uniref:Uncharacterized protein n=1 Tax=Domibacillus epiphyticus TaxID=1714355 RepID=A0A1V2A457_9BACI|nr:hypothetical protein [Domibacillus epiphyticus]OMP65727.1 hypothetical protein BTO28_15790 [Domibacillus epiphyticus]
MMNRPDGRVKINLNDESRLWINPNYGKDRTNTLIADKSKSRLQPDEDIKNNAEEKKERKRHELRNRNKRHFHLW